MRSVAILGNNIKLIYTVIIRDDGLNYSNRQIELNRSSDVVRSVLLDSKMLDASIRFDSKTMLKIERF